MGITTDSKAKTRDNHGHEMRPTRGITTDAKATAESNTAMRPAYI